MKAYALAACAFFLSQRRESVFGFADKRFEQSRVFAAVRPFQARMGIHSGGADFQNGLADIVRTQAACQYQGLVQSLDERTADCPRVRLAGGPAGARGRVETVGDECVRGLSVDTGPYAAAVRESGDYCELSDF